MILQEQDLGKLDLGSITTNSRATRREMFGGSGFSDFFETLFGQGNGRSGNYAGFGEHPVGSDLAGEITISLQESLQWKQSALQTWDRRRLG